MIGGVAAARAIRKTTGIHPRIKWPNDLLLGGRKAAGILAESVILGDAVCYAVLGIGINVSLDVSESDEISSIATSVNSAAGKEADRESLLRQLLLELTISTSACSAGTLRFPSGGDCWTPPADESTRPPATRLSEGWRKTSTITGNLLLRLDDGRLITLTAGDVTLGGADQS